MGGGSSSTDSSNPNEMRSRERRANERKTAFEQRGSKSSYYNTPVEYKQKAGKKGGYSEVDRNTRLARDLESQASASTTITGNKAIDMMIPGYGALTNVSAFSKRQQASALRGGGNPVYDTKGDYQGVVSKNFIGANVYSGNADYSPIGRSQGASFNSATGTYTSSQMQQDSGSESSNNTPTNTQVAVENKTDSTTSLDPKAKRSLLANSQGGANTRYFIRT